MEPSPGSGVGNIDVSREAVNDHGFYYRQVTLQVPESGDGFKRFLFSMLYDNGIQRDAEQRKEHLDQLAATLNNQEPNFVTLATEGAGVCGIRLALLAMTLPQAVKTR